MGKDLIRAALAGGIASSSSTLALHPLDTLKTRIQAFDDSHPRGRVCVNLSLCCR